MKLPAPPPDWEELMRKLGPDRALDLFRYGVEPAPDGRYSHWESLRHKKPPEGLHAEEWWFAVKWARGRLQKRLPLLDKASRPFTFAMVDPVQEMVHQIDRRTSGRAEVPEEVTNPATRDRYLMRFLQEEAITSSQIEGAATTARVAKEMIRSGRKPKDRSERMILNNYHAIQAIRGMQDRGEGLSPEAVLDLQRVLTEGALDSEDAAGRLRRPDEPIQVVDNRDQAILHVPPRAEELPERLEEMCRFANGETPDFFVHPVVRSILLHFWLAWDHPFVDGNGRTARALFYWSMLRHGYWLCEFLSISSVIKKKPAAYRKAFLYTETDDNDATYFLLYHLEMVLRALHELEEYLRRQTAKVRETEDLLRHAGDFNHRQRALLGHALRHPGFTYTIRSHQTSHGVVYQTARTDLLDLADRELLVQEKVGRTFTFRSPEDLMERIGG